MRLELDEYRTIVETAPNLIWRAGLDAKCNYFNKTWLKFTGRTMQQECGDGWAEGVHPDDLERCVQTYLENFGRRTRFEMEYRMRRYDGQWRWINDIGVPIFDDNGEFEGYIGSCLDVTEKVEGQILKEMAQKDGLTGVYNRQYLMGLAQDSFEKAKKSGSKLTVAMMDMDKLKLINDLYGHLVGDSAIRTLASVVQSNLRKTDLFGRYGGDEFLIVFSDAGQETAKSIIDKIANKLKAVSIKCGDTEVAVSVSVGICELSDENMIDEMISKADRLMYDMKGKRACNTKEALI